MQKISSSSLKSVFIAAENENTSLKGGAFTIKSNQTGKDYTYKVVTKPYNKRNYTHVYVEKGYNTFSHLGVYRGSKIWKSRKVVETPSAVAIGFVLDKVEKDQISWLDEKISTYHLGTCLKCGKTLTDSHSIEVGIGPVCESKL